MCCRHLCHEGSRSSVAQRLAIEIDHYDVFGVLLCTHCRIESIELYFEMMSHLTNATLSRDQADLRDPVLHNWHFMILEVTAMSCTELSRRPIHLMAGHARKGRPLRAQF